MVGKWLTKKPIKTKKPLENQTINKRFSTEDGT